ncbi:MAG: hypothetical protein EA381_08880 [Planctomycetaceae bacterium]|jgi:hypothetical protein|nr:MAG: hypothetical protein EA381_08880 [Planctomycetaceae bacterium]
MFKKLSLVVALLLGSLVLSSQKAEAQMVFRSAGGFPVPMVGYPPAPRMYRPYVPSRRYVSGGIYSNWGQRQVFAPVSRSYRPAYGYGMRGYGVRGYGYPVYVSPYGGRFGNPYVRSGVSLYIGN